MRTVLSTVTALMLLAPVASAQEAKTFWKDFIKGCATNDLIRGDVLYLGPDNTSGPGTVFRKVGKNWNPGPAFDSSAAPEDIRKQVLKLNKAATCTGSKSKTAKANFSLILTALASPFTGSASADFNRAKTMNVSVDSWAWDSLLDPTFGQNLGKYAAGYRQAALENYVIGRALRVTNLSADMEFDNSSKAGIEAKYKDKGPVDVGAGLKAEWTSKGTLKVTASDTVYIAGQMYKVNESGFKSGKVTKYLLPEPVSATDTVVARQ
jgi:hypothetical protein